MHTNLTKVAALALTTAAFSLPAFAQTMNSNSTATPPAAMAPAPNAGASSNVMRPNAQNGVMRPAQNNDMAMHNSTAMAPDMTADGSRRMSKLIGMDVVNDKDQTIGKVDDVLIGADGKATTAVISVGGFLGVGAKLVSVPYGTLQRAPNDRQSLTVPNASKEQLKSMPEFKYGQGA